MTVFRSPRSRGSRSPFTFAWTLGLTGMVATASFGPAYGQSAEAEPPPAAAAKAPSQMEPHWDYPELLAVPSASTLVRDYAQKEPSRSQMSYIPLQLMGLGNILVGAKAMGEKKTFDDDGSVSRNPKLAGQVAIGIGLATIGGTYLLSTSYTPYRTGVRTLKRYGGTSQKARLTKEREAEHIIAGAASTARSVRLLGVLGNAAAAVNILSHTEDDNTKIGAALTILAAIGPFMFTPYQITLPGRYDGYKKRIYGPVSFLSATKGGIAGNFGLRLSF